MAKRLTREQKKEQALVDIINMMFEIAGHDVTYEDIKDRKDDWFTQWTMTVEQNEEWQQWGRRYLMKKFRCTVTTADREMQWTSLAYGLKFSNWDEYIKSKQNANTKV